MSKTIIIALAFVLVAVRSLSAQSLDNGDFGYPSENPGIPEGWTTWGDWFLRETVWDPRPPSGAMMGYHHYRVDGSNKSGMHQDVTGVKAGQKVRFSILMMVDAHSADSRKPHAVELILEAGKDGRQETVASTEIALADFPADEEWHEVSVEGTLPVDNLRVVVSVTPSPTGPRQSAVKFSEANFEVLE
jgi:hypothetical protein